MRRNPETSGSPGSESKKIETKGVEQAPMGWITNHALSVELGVTPHAIKEIADRYRVKKYEKYFREYLNSINSPSEHFSPELADIIRTEIKKREKAPVGWMRSKHLAEELGVDAQTVKRIAEKNRTPANAGWFKHFYINDTETSEHFHPDLVAIIRQEIESREVAPEGWMTNGSLAADLGVAWTVVNLIAVRYKDGKHTGWFNFYKDKIGKLEEHFHPDLVAIIRQEIGGREVAPAGWMTNESLCNDLEVDRSTTARVADKYREKKNEHWFRYYLDKTNKSVEHYHPELVIKIREELESREKVPAGWMTRKSLKKQYSWDERTTARIAARFRDEEHKGWFKFYLDAGGRSFEHWHPDLIKIIRAEMEAPKTSDGSERNERRREQQKLEQQLIELAEKIKNKDGLEAERFQKLLSLFGSAKVLDILYSFRPEFKGIPVERVKSIVADYLGDLLAIRRDLNISDLAEAGEYLKQKELRESLAEVVKVSALDFFHKAKKSESGKQNSEIFKDYFAEVRAQIQGSENAELEVVIESVEAYYTSILAYEKPKQVIDVLQEGREFPDINQLVNIKELEEKNKILIADEMGLGKSASAILAKEYLKVKQALVVVPSNVVETWRAYLVKYFKPEQKPKVLVVENLQQLDEDLTSYDYVIISQEKLNEKYTQKLENLDYGMLILDEVHKLKNITEGKRSGNALKLAKKIEGEGKYLAMLSGTPVPNKVEDVAMILKLLYPERFEHLENRELVQAIIKGEIVDLRNLLVPRMQMKSLQESIEMPQHLEAPPVEVTLSGPERFVYNALLEQSDLTAPQKIKAFRQLLINPELLEAAPDVESSKVKRLNTQLAEDFNDVNKIVVFFNGYVENVLRGERSILKSLNLPEGVQLRVIEGNVPREERERIQAELNTSDSRILLLVSGQTSDVGVDFSGGEMVYFYNEPWTKGDMAQQLSRVYRPGLKKDLKSRVFITKDTIEDGIHTYIEVKQRSIEKLLKGLPITDLEQALLQQSEKAEGDPEFNAELAEYYFNSWDRLMQIFSEIKKRKGEKKFSDYLLEYGREYAECYLDLGARSYQANAARVASTILEMQIESAPDREKIRILDIASGPEMLKKHISEEHQNSVTSMDINAFHFQGEGKNRVVGGFRHLPFQAETFDYANLSFALHYTRWNPSKNDYERAEVLAEANRILKPGGRLVINLIYSQDLKTPEKLNPLVEKLGFKVVEEFTGVVSRGANYKSRVVTLEKVTPLTKPVRHLLEPLDKADKTEGLKLYNSKQGPSDSRKIIEDFNLGGHQINIRFNRVDRRILDAEKSIIAQGNYLKRTHKGIRKIPTEKLKEYRFTRFYDGNKYILFKNLSFNEGVVLVK